MYGDMIRESLARLGRIGINPRWVEAWMRLELGTLDWVDHNRFQREVEIAAECCLASTDSDNEALASSILGV